MSKNAGETGPGKEGRRGPADGCERDREEAAQAEERRHSGKEESGVRCAQ